MDPLILLGLLGLGCASAESPSQPAPSVAPLPPTPVSTEAERLVAVGDLHADLPATLALFSALGLVDGAGRWSGGQTILVQTGDITDRGPDSKELIALLDRLEEEAAAAGGRVVGLLGNHELMNLQGDWRYVSEGDVADYGSVDARKVAFSPTGEAGARLRGQDAIAQVGSTLFLHGGLSERFAASTVAQLNEQVRQAINEPGAPILGEEGPLWYRGYLLADEAVACAELQRVLALRGVRRMVVGHTTQRDGRIAVRCGGALLGIDTGISAHYGGHAAAVELRAGDAWAWYPTGWLDLPDPR